MKKDDRKLSYSERDKLRRERGGGAPRTGQQRAADEERSRQALVAADALFTAEPGGEEGKALSAAVKAAHGTPGLGEACRAYSDALGVPKTAELFSIFLDAGEKELSVAVLDEMLHQQEQGSLEIAGGLKRQIRILSEDFDNDLASRAEELLE